MNESGCGGCLFWKDIPKRENWGLCRYKIAPDGSLMLDFPDSWEIRVNGVHRMGGKNCVCWAAKGGGE